MGGGAVTLILVYSEEGTGGVRYALLAREKLTLKIYCCHCVRAADARRATRDARYVCDS